jgi:hypothetical protein
MPRSCCLQHEQGLKKTDRAISAGIQPISDSCGESKGPGLGERTYTSGISKSLLPGDGSEVLPEQGED